MDRDLTPETRRRNLIRRVAPVVIGIVVVLFTAGATLEWMRPSLRRDQFQTAVVRRGRVEATIQAAGTVIPLVEHVVSSPVEARVLRISRRAGDRLRAGDEIVSLDTSATRLDLGRLDDRVAQRSSEVTRLRLQLDETIGSLMSQLEQRKLDAQIYRYRAEQNRKLRSEGLVSEQDDLAATASEKKAAIEVAQIEAQIARARRTAEAQLAAAALELATARKEQAEARRQLDLAMTRADRDGVLTWVVQEEGGTVRRGDVIARIADLSSFRVVATISDVHASRIAAGMPVIVKADDTAIRGVISAVDPRIENGVARFYADLSARNHPKLRNNLRVDVFVVTGGKDGVLQLRRGLIAQAPQEDVFVVRGKTLVRTSARFGLSGEENVEVTSGLGEGDEVVISNMTDYKTLKQLRIK